MFERISASVKAYLVPIFIKFFYGLFKYKLSKKQLRPTTKADNEMRAEQVKEWEWIQELEEEIKEAKEREWRQELEEAIKEAEDSAAKQAKEKDAKQDQVVKGLIEEMILLREKLERETQERKEAQKKQNKKINSIEDTIDNGIKLFNDCMLRRQLWSCHCGMHPCRCQPQILEYDERVKLLTHFQLPKDGDDDLDNIFNASYLSLQDKPNHSFDTAESSEKRNDERNPQDILNMVIATINDPENAQDTTLLELNYQLFEDDQESSEMIPTKNEVANQVITEKNRIKSEVTLLNCEIQALKEERKRLEMELDKHKAATKEMKLPHESENGRGGRESMPYFVIVTGIVIFVVLKFVQLTM